ncbi:1-acyl-sn-glycerol-3-phosphate acyltransferase [Maribius pontilimi]|uniref:1-acyl-sn-glycerol-3-phosphate acyltransferase n=1 Tax=Palleronia pontilimi TaxID=1964209 RepID=A0A934IJH7_9RHOB|nr:lysophospholipid acyltransferase family protein [Palleronia pontilimi]MBJ3764068.1 1-acyl-sn-glycerol-3-phosphate acyltransferase [Palleronia pontilimi]
MKPLQFVRSLAFNTQMYIAMAVIGIGYLPYAAIHPQGARKACKAYCRWVIWTASWMVGLKSEVRGPVPTDQVMVAAKHQSFLDIILIFNAVPRGKFIMKRELMYAPILGFYAYRIGCVFVNRGKRGKAIGKMVRDVKSGSAKPGQLCIYPQGTRIAPGVAAPYKIGTHVLYDQLEQPCVPVACNVGVFWEKRGVMRHPGTAIVEFLDPIRPGLSRTDFMKRLEDAIEQRSNALNEEAGFKRIEA